MKSKRIRKRFYWALAGLLVALSVIVVLNYGVIVRLFSPHMEELWSKVTPGMVMKLLAKCGIVSLATGLVTRWLQNRKDRFLNGVVEHRLQKDYSLVVGYNFQVKPLIKKLLCSDESLTVLLMTDRDVRSIRLEFATELTKDEIGRLLFMRRDLAVNRSYQNLRIRGARSIYLMGDEGCPGRDGIILRASEMIAAKAASEQRLENEAPVRAFLQFENPNIYSQMRSQELSLDRKDADGRAIFDLEVFNYYDSWVWKCWSEKDSSDGSDPYLPIRFKPDAERVELFVIGSGMAAKAVVDSAITLMNYGDDARHCRLTIVSDRVSEIMPPDDVVASLPELELVDYSPKDLSRKVAAKMVDAAADEKCAVTVAIIEDAPEKSMKAYMNLPFALRNKEISVLLWMETQTRNLTEKPLIKIGGDRTELRYFGMTDCPPWFGSNRQAMGVAVQYYYTDCYGDKRMPKGTDVSLISVAKELWDEDKAKQEWKNKERWGKWSSICSAGSFKEKMSIICGRALTSELQLKLLKAEHNRWWAERLLADWRPGKRDNDRRLHPNLVPFEQLDEFTKDVDKLCIAAMAQQGFIVAGA